MKAYKFRLYPNKRQQELINKTFGCCRYVYNYYLNKELTSYKSNSTTKLINSNEWCLDLTYLRKELNWLKEVESTALRCTLENLEDAYKNYFRNIQNGKKANIKFKSKKSNVQSYTTKSQQSIKIFDGYVFLPKLKKIKCKVSQEVKGKIFRATVSRTKSKKYFVSIWTDYVPEKYSPSLNNIGIDLGVKDFLIDSNGMKYNNPKWTNLANKKIKRKQRMLSRKQIGSKNFDKAKQLLAIQYEKVKNQRIDYLQKLSTKIIKENNIIVLEKLDIKNMIKNKKYSKGIMDVSWGLFIEYVN